MQRLSALIGLLACGASGCDEPSVTAAPEPLGSPKIEAATEQPAAPATTSDRENVSPAEATGGGPSTSPALSASPAAVPSASPSAAIDASKKPASNLTDDEVCKGAAREGCIPKNDPFGFVARE